MDALTAASETVFQKDLPGGFTLSLLPASSVSRLRGSLRCPRPLRHLGGLCPSCGTIVAVRPVPTWAMGILDGLEAVACEQRSHGRLSVRRCSSCSRVLPQQRSDLRGEMHWCGQEHEGGAQWDFFFLMSFDADQLVDHWMADEERALSLLETDFEEEHAPALKIDPGLMAPLLHHPSVEVRTAMASWTRLPRSLGMELIHDRAPEVRKVVASWSEISLGRRPSWPGTKTPRSDRAARQPLSALGTARSSGHGGDLFLLRSVSRHPSLRRFSRDALQHLVEADDEPHPPEPAEDQAAAAGLAGAGQSTLTPAPDAGWPGPINFATSVPSFSESSSRKRARFSRPLWTTRKWISACSLAWLGPRTWWFV